MYGELNKLEEMKAKLNEVSPSFCMAKWMHSTLHLLNGETHSCYLPPTHKIPQDMLESNPSVLHNTPEKKLQRQMMLEGKRPPGCNICWKVEDLPGNQVSDRHMRATESWTMPYFEKVKALKWDGDINPTYLEVSFSSICNFKCSYCSPHVSSSWEAEIKKFGIYRLSNEQSHQDIQYLPMPIPEEQENPYIEAFWKWLPSLYKDLVHFRVTGGEPLLSRHTYRLMDWIKANPHPRLHFSINSNMCVPKLYLDRFFAELKTILEKNHLSTFMLHTSLDTFGAQAEYIRHGLKFEEYNQNVRRFLTEFPNASLAFMCTFNALSVVGYGNFLSWLKDLRQEFSWRRGVIHLDIPHLMDPSYMNIRILPENYLKYIESHLQYMEQNKEDRAAKIAGFRKNEISKMRRIYETMKTPADETWLKQARKDFYLFFSEHDKRRGTDFISTFPEMRDHYEMCRNLL